LKGVMAVEID